MSLVSYYYYSTRIMLQFLYTRLQYINLKVVQEKVSINLHSSHNHLTALIWDYPGKPVPAENIHPLTPILITGHPLSTSSIHYNPLHPLCSVYVLDSLFNNLSPGHLWSSSWSWTLNFILHAFLHPIIIFFSQHMPKLPIPLQPVLL